MVTAEFTRKRPRSRTRAPVKRRRIAARRAARSDPLREFMFRHVGKLSLATTVTLAVSSALEQQKAEQDGDLALVLKRHVGDVLASEVEALQCLLQEPKAEEGAYRE